MTRTLECHGCGKACPEPIHYTFWRNNLRVYLQFCDDCHEKILAVMNSLDT